MASRAARKRRRLEEERKRLASLEVRGTLHTRCSDVTLAELDVLLAQADELFGRIVTHAARARTTWLGAAAASGRATLATALERARRFQRSGVHIHLCGELAVRMVPLAARGSSHAFVQRYVEDDQVYGGDDGVRAPEPDDIPF